MDRNAFPLDRGQESFNQNDLMNSFNWDDSEQIEHWEKVKAKFKKNKNEARKKNTVQHTQNSPDAKPEKPNSVECEDVVPEYASMPQQASNLEIDDELTNMMMAWYYCGYYTAQYLTSLP